MNEFREEIDKLDKNITDLLIKRFDMSLQIGLYKKTNNLEIENFEREEKILKSLEGPYEKKLKNIYKFIFKESKDLQKELHKLLQKNIVLIGMPASGKTTVGKIVAKKTNRKFYDLDEEFTGLYGNPERFIIEKGEEEFRALESEILKKFSDKNYTVIATGGGIVERQENYLPLRENSIVYYLDRDTDKLKLFGLQPSYKNNLYKLKERREKLYIRFSDVTIKNNSAPEDAALEIIKNFNKTRLVMLRAGVLL